MSRNRQMRAEHLTAEGADADAEIRKMLAGALSDDGAADEAAIEAAQQNFVPGPTAADPTAGIMMPTEKALARIIGSTGGGGSGVSKLTGENYNSPERIMSHYDKATYSAFTEALAHKEDAPTATCLVGHGKDAVVVPPSVRDNPNKLYFKADSYGYHHPIREKADKILVAVFNDHQPDPAKLNLADRAFECAAKCGLDQKPLLFWSQKIWHTLDLVLVKPEAIPDWIAANPSPDNEFREYTDTDNGSLILQTLRKFLTETTMRHLMTMVRLNKCSVLACVRAIGNGICDSKNVSTHCCDNCDAHYWYAKGVTHKCPKAALSA